MLDAFSPFHYKSCAILAAFSKNEWNRHIAKPSPSGGKTNLVTCGIITNEVGSKVSQKTGRAFAMIELGDLSNSKLSSYGASGTLHASVTVFLFGDALRVLIANNKRYLMRGYVLAVLGPSFMPPKDEKSSSSSDGRSTAVSLSVSDPKQILMIGKCIDCDRCKGTIRKRTMSEFGHAKFDDVRCGSLVDLRMGGFCTTHKKQGLSSSGQGVRGKVNGTTGNSLKSVQVAKRKDVGSVSIQMGARNGLASSRVSEALAQAGLLENPYSMPHAGFLNSQTPTASQQLLKRAPLHMKKEALTNQTIWSNTSTPLSQMNNAAERTNPYKISKPKESTQRKSAEDILGAALQRKRQKTEGLATIGTSKSSTSKRPVKVFHTEGYDGAVQIPNPNSILFKGASSVLINGPTQSVKKRLSADATQSVLDRQANLAALLKERNAVCATVKGSGASNAKRTLPRNNTISKPRQDDPFASIFGQDDPLSSQPLDRDAILNAKSRFASEATAEEYARARSVVQQLEVRETEMDQRKARMEKKKAGVSASKSASIITSWECRSCRTKTTLEPKMCIRAGHVVRHQRELKEKKSTSGSRKDRMERHGKEDTDGGLTLGSGLEWSGWRGVD
jgi:hypothetical protein